MKNYRYEDYSQLKEHIPCIVNSAIIRTKNILSPTANWHKNIEIQLCCEGSGFVILDSIKTTITPGDVVVIGSNIIHYTGTDDFIKYHCIIIDTDFFEKAGINNTNIQFENIFKDSIVMNFILDAIEIYKTTDDICYIAKLQCAILKILIEIRTNHTQSVLQTKHENRYFNGVKEVIRYIQNNYDKKITLDFLAKITFIDKYSLSKKFKEFTGNTIVEYINGYRCNQAILMIENGESICDTARKCGFNNLSFFTKTFKKFTGNLPSFYK